MTYEELMEYIKDELRRRQLSMAWLSMRSGLAVNSVSYSLRFMIYPWFESVVKMLDALKLQLVIEGKVCRTTSDVALVIYEMKKKEGLRLHMIAEWAEMEANCFSAWRRGEHKAHAENLFRVLNILRCDIRIERKETNTWQTSRCVLDTDAR